MNRNLNPLQFALPRKGSSGATKSVSPDEVVAEERQNKQQRENLLRG